MMRLLKSIIASVGRAIINDPGVRRFIERHPRLSYFIRRRFTPDEKFGLYLTAGSALTVFFLYLFFGLARDVIGQQSIIQADLRIINLLQLFRDPITNEFMLLITYLGKWQIVIPAVCAVSTILLLFKRRHYFLALIVSVGGGELFVWITKNIIERTRPPLINALSPEMSYSFPSGHAFVAIAFYGFLGYILFRESRSKLMKAFSVLIIFSIIVLIGFSRIYLGVHWPSDVLASYTAAVAWIAALITALEIRRKFNHEQSGSPRMSHAAGAALGIIFFAVWSAYVFEYYRMHPLHNPEVISRHYEIISSEDIPGKLFQKFPRTSEDIMGKPMEPISIIAVGIYPQITQAFRKAGWYVMDPISARTFWHFYVASAFNQSYPQAPATPSFWNARPNEFAFEQPTAANTVRERHHIHIWETPFVLDDGRNVWFGTAHFDEAMAMKLGVPLPTHTIHPAVDRERDKVKDDLVVTGDVETTREFRITQPTLGSNQAGDQFFTDGKAYVIFLKK